MITIVDCGMGNLRSVQKAFEHLRFPVQISADPKAVRNASRLVLPGDGAFGDEMKNLEQLGLLEPLRDALARQVPLLGICVGQQVLFDESEEFGLHAGLGLFRGKLRRLPKALPVPHMGWNQLHIQRPSRLLKGVDAESFVYFIHSYYVSDCEPDIVTATTDYGIEFPVATESENIFSVQFHPEKSQRPGLRILENFAKM
ncbi:MAG: imidazole glycerol phosphate synthase subunit HisH [Acidobacteriia bacterium]|nr:imidazole glycerol phosphate synthase subunit HisH [Terriglobia bacterium]